MCPQFSILLILVLTLYILMVVANPNVYQFHPQLPHYIKSQKILCIFFQWFSTSVREQSVKMNWPLIRCRHKILKLTTNLTEIKQFPFASMPRIKYCFKTFLSPLYSFIHFDRTASLSLNGIFQLFETWAMSTWNYRVFLLNFYAINQFIDFSSMFCTFAFWSQMRYEISSKHNFSVFVSIFCQTKCLWIDYIIYNKQFISTLTFQHIRLFLN